MVKINLTKEQQEEYNSYLNEPVMNPLLDLYIAIIEANILFKKIEDDKDK